MDFFGFRIGALGVFGVIGVADILFSCHVAQLLIDGDVQMDLFLKDFYHDYGWVANFVPKLRYLVMDFVENGYEARLHVVVSVYILHAAIFVVGVVLSLPFVGVTCERLREHMIKNPGFTKERMDSMVGLISLGIVAAPISELLYYSDDINSKRNLFTNLAYENYYHLFHPAIAWSISGFGAIFIVVRFIGKKYDIL